MPETKNKEKIFVKTETMQTKFSADSATQCNKHIQEQIFNLTFGKMLCKQSHKIESTTIITTFVFN